MKSPVTTRLIDIVFPGDTNHHGTLFGGVGLALMDKVAFIVASRHAPVNFVTASCERIDFKMPANLGEIIELNGRIVRVGRRSMAVEVELIAEELVSGKRRQCSCGIFNMVGIDESYFRDDRRLPPVMPVSPELDDELRMVEMVFPEQTSHYGSLYGGHAMAAMSKGAFVTATRHCRKPVVLASSRRVDFAGRIQQGEVMEVRSRLVATGTTSMTIRVGLWAENVQSGESRQCAEGEFVMVAKSATSGIGE